MAERRRSNDAVAPPAEALKDAGQRLLDLLVQRSAEAATQRVNGLTVRLSDVTDSGGDLRAALRRNPEKDGQASRPGGLRGTLSAAWRRALSGLQDKMQNIFGGGSGAEQLARSRPTAAHDLRRLDAIRRFPQLQQGRNDRASR